MTDRETLILAALLHDIGKFRERAKQSLSQSSYPEARYEHEPHSWEFIDQHKQLFTDAHTIASIALKHHLQELFDEKLVALADRISADEREEEKEATESSTRFTAPLVVTTSYLFENRPYTYFDLLPISLSEVKFPEPYEQLSIDEEKYARHWRSFEQEVNLVPSKDDFTTVFYLYQKYTWCITSSASKGEIHDISLFNHSKIVAAIVACLLREEIDEKTVELLLSREATEWEKPHFLLVKGDLSGIQSFLYTITSKGAAKGLRGRSLYLQLLTEVVATWLLDKFGLPVANLLYVGGGHFYLLLPLGVKGQIEHLRAEISDKLLRAHKGDLYLALGQVELSARDFDPEIFSGKWGEVANEANKAKQHRFSELNESIFDRIFQPQGEGGLKETCDVCGDEEGKWKLDIDQETAKCHLCESFEELGQEVADSKYILEVKLDREADPGEERGWKSVFAQFGFGFYFLEDLNSKPKGISGRSAILYRLNDSGFLCEESRQFANSLNIPVS